MTTFMIHHGNPHEPASNPGKAIARMPKIQRQLQLLDATRHFETFRQKARILATERGWFVNGIIMG